MTISFQANYISPQSIRQINKIKPSKISSASFIELDHKDRLVIDEVHTNWGEKSEYSRHILCELEDSSIHKNLGKRFFALTLQNKNFDKLFANKILGIAEIVEESFERVKLKFLQVDPLNNNNCADAKFRGIGSAILNALKDCYPSRELYVFSSESAKDFYIANKFKYISKNTYSYNPVE